MNIKKITDAYQYENSANAKEYLTITNKFNWF